MRNFEKNDKELGTRKAANESGECELVIADSLGTNKLPGKKVLLQALQNLFAEEISLQRFEKKSSLTRYCAKKVQKEYRTGSVRNGVTVSKQPGKLMRLLHYLLRKKLLPFVSVEGLKTQAAKSLKFRHARIRQKVPKAYSATTMLKKTD